MNGRTKRILSIVLTLCMLVSLFPATALGLDAAAQTQSQGTEVVKGSSIPGTGYHVTSVKNYSIAPDISERVIITNNDAGNSQTVANVMEVNTSGGRAKIVAGYGNRNPKEQGWTLKTTTDQAHVYEKESGLNVVGGVNASWFNINTGEPSGYLVMNGVVHHDNSSRAFIAAFDDGSVNVFREGTTLAQAEADQSAKQGKTVKILEAVDALVAMVWDGKVVITESGNSGYYPRTCVGIKADGTVVLFQADGTMAPRSVGYTAAEEARMMVALGCVAAIQLDEGGSSTYISQREGEQDVTMRNTPAGGSERVTAEDFVYAWQRLVDPATASPNASLLSMVAGYDEVRESGDVSLLGVKAKGESTFLVTLSRPCAYFITSVCTSPATAPLRRDLVEGNASWAATADIVTNGPYTVGTWVKAAQLQTKRNGEYYESKLVVPDSICFRFETDAQTNYDQLLAGELDYTAKLPYAAIEQLAEDETWQPAPLAETVCVLYNHLTDTFSDAQLRRAFDLAIDRAALAEQLGVTATAATGCVPDGISDAPESGEDFRTAGGELCAADAEGYAERSAEAARLMTSAGHYQGAGLPTLRFLFVEGEQTRAAALSLFNMWRTATGVAVELVGVSAEELDAALAAGDFDLALTTLTARCDDPMEYLLPFRGTSESNVCGYRNDTFDLLVGVAESTGDLTARAAFLHDAEAMLLEDSAVSPLCFSGTAYLLREGFTGVSHDCFGHSYFTAVSRAETSPAA